MSYAHKYHKVQIYCSAYIREIMWRSFQVFIVNIHFFSLISCTVNMVWSCKGVSKSFYDFRYWLFLPSQWFGSNLYHCSWLISDEVKKAKTICWLFFKYFNIRLMNLIYSYLSCVAFFNTWKHIFFSVVICNGKILF